MAEALHAWARTVHDDSGGRVTRIETIHLTLAFLGDVAQERLPILKSLPVKGGKFVLPIDTARYWKHNQIVWVGPSAIPPALAEAAASLESVLKKNQFRTEERPYAAHITLIRKARAPQSIPALPAITWPASEAVLVRSQLSGKGSRYEVLQRYPLS